MQTKDKYQLAIIDFELARKEIVSLSKCIGSYICTKLDDQQNTCLGRQWKENIEAENNHDYYGSKIKEEPEQLEMCHDCEQTQILIDKRKLAKKAFGIQKRRISSLGANLLKGISKE